jgi:NADPH:quinone reductase-like Zn-dependent oxidoreductase
MVLPRPATVEGRRTQAKLLIHGIGWATVWGAGVRALAAEVELLDLPAPRGLRPDELLVEVQAAGVGHWDEIARTGGWDLGRLPPMALGVEAAGVVLAAGEGLVTFKPGDRVLAHSAPLRDQGAWSEQFVVPAASAAVLPEAVPFDVGGGFPVPALTADQALSEGVGLGPGQVVLVHGAGGVTGTLIVRLAVSRGATVVATASARSASRLRQAGAEVVVDSRSPAWADQLRARVGDRGFDAAVNAVPNGAASVLDLVREGGRLATITSDPPPAQRGVEVQEVYVAPDGARLQGLTAMLAAGTLPLPVGAAYPLGSAKDALAHVLRGSDGNAIVVGIGPLKMPR